MKAAVISIGNELLSGFTINTNLAWLGQNLLNIGINVSEQVSINDDRSQIRRYLHRYIKLYDLIIMTGGLGPTHDDLTPFVLYDYFNDKTVFDKEYWNEIKSYYKLRKQSIPEINKNQALRPTMGIMIPNDIGSAKGIHYKKNNALIFALPGVPSEMKTMMSKYIIPQLVKLNNQDIHVLSIRTVGKGESAIAEKIKSIVNKYSTSCSIAFLPQISGVDIRLMSHDKDQLDECSFKIENKLNLLIYGKNEDSLEKVTGLILKNNNKTISIAESCTGGLVSHLLTSVSGCSKYFLGGVIAYNNKIKRDILGVQQSTLTKFGAVSKETALELSRGIKKKYLSTIGLSITGIAGPTGGTDKKPVGLVYIGYSSSQNNFFRKYFFHGTRKTIKYMSAISAIDLVRNELINE